MIFSDEQKNELTRWLISSTKHKLLLPFLLVLKGLRITDKDFAKEILISSVILDDIVDWVDNSVYSSPTRWISELTQESRQWLGELLFQDIIESVDKLVAKIYNLQNPSRKDSTHPKV